MSRHTSITLHDVDGNPVAVDAFSITDNRHIGEQARKAEVEAARVAALYPPCECINLRELIRWGA